MNRSNQFVEEVSGHIVGDIYSTGQLFNESRPQGPRFNGNHEEIRVQAQEYANGLKDRLGAEYLRLYPNGMELRIWD